MLRKLDAILAKADPANGATEAECIAAIAKAQELMAEYGIKEAEVLMHRADKDAASQGPNLRDITSHNLDTGTIEHSCYPAIFRIIRALTGVRMIRSKYFHPQRNKIYFRAILVGLEVDIRCAVMLFMPLKNLMRRMPPKRAKGMGQKLTCAFENSYYLGVEKGVLEENEKAKAACAEASPQAGACWSLVLVKKDALVKQWAQENIPGLHYPKGKGHGERNNAGAFMAGVHDGKEMQIHKAIS